MTKPRRASVPASGRQHLVATWWSLQIRETTDRLRLSAVLGLDTRLTPDAAIAVCQLLELLAGRLDVVDSLPAQNPQERPCP